MPFFVMQREKITNLVLNISCNLWAEYMCVIFLGLFVVFVHCFGVVEKVGINLVVLTNFF